MTIILNGSNIELSNDVTHADIYNSSYFTQPSSTENKVQPQYNVILKSSLNWRVAGLIWDIVGKSVTMENSDDDIWIEAVTFLFDEATDHYKLSGKLRDCQVHGRKGGNDLLNLLGVDNVVVVSANVGSSGANRDFGVFINKSGVHRGLIARSVGRVGSNYDASESATQWFKKFKFIADNTTATVGNNGGVSYIWEDLNMQSLTTGAMATVYIDEYASGRDHTYFLLGSSVSAFYGSGTTISHDSETSPLTIFRTGGIKYWDLIGGDGAVVVVFDSRNSTTPQKLIPTISNWELLDAATTLTVSSNEKAEFVTITGENTRGASVNTVLNLFTGHKVLVSKYGKKLFVKSYLDRVSAETTEGSEENYAPILLEDDPNITDSKVVTDARVSLSNLIQVYHVFHSEKMESVNYARPDVGQLIATANGKELDFLNVNIRVDSTATLTNGKAGEFTRDIKSLISVAENGSGKARFTSTAHGFITGQIVNITGTTNYNDYSVINVIDVDTFDTTQNFTSETLSGANATLDLATIKSSALAKDTQFEVIKTNGKISIRSGDAITASYFDSTFNSTLVFSGIDSWKLYTSELDMDSNTNLVASGLVSDVYQFAFSSGATYWLRLTSGTDTILKNVTPTTAGITSVDLTQAGQLTVINNSISGINDNIKQQQRLIWVDTTNPTDGEGTSKSPFNNFSSAKTFAESEGVNIFNVVGTATLDVDLKNYIILGGSTISEIDLNNKNVSGTTFKEVVIEGEAATDAGKYFKAKHCVFKEVTGLNGVFNDCIFAGNIAVKNGADIDILNCASGLGGTARPILSMSGSVATDLSVRGWKGGLTLKDSTDASNVITISGTEASFTIDSTNTDGVFNVRSMLQIENQASGATVVIQQLNTTNVNDQILTEVKKLTN